jgi:hypothetical protein
MRVLGNLITDLNPFKILEIIKKFQPIQLACRLPVDQLPGQNRK